MPKENESTYSAYPAHREYVDGDAHDKATADTDDKSTWNKNYSLAKKGLTLDGSPLPVDDNGKPYVAVKPPRANAVK